VSGTLRCQKKAKLLETPSVKVMDKHKAWDDIANGNGWRIQQNKATKHFRLLSPESIHQGNAMWKNFSKFLSCIVEIGKENQGSIEFKINDSSLAITDRRVIIIAADNGSVKYDGVPHYTISKANDMFKFPLNHPITNSSYAMLDVNPNYYVPLAGFHEHYKQNKHAAFIELCANLGAKEICIESAEINEQTLDIKADIKTPISKLGLGLNVVENHETGQKIAFKFSDANKHIKEFDSPWLYTEPSWMSMYNLRRNNHLMELGAEFTCLDDMGINASLSNKLKGIGVNIGGNFQEMTKIRLSYSVIFWE